jgi:hypothetical protein
MSQPLAFKAAATLLACGMIVSVAATLAQPARAEQYQSRLSRLLIRNADLYLPTRLVIGEEARFVVKAPAGNHVKVLLSPDGEGYTLPDGTSLRVGTEAQELIGVVPENGVLELTLDIPQEAELAGKVLYIDAASGPTDEALVPMTLMDPTGRKADSNVLVIAKPAELGAPMIMPTMPGGLTPQAFNQLSQMSQVYASKDERKKQLMMDNGDLDRSRQMDNNPFTQRGLQKGL